MDATLVFSYLLQDAITSCLSNQNKSFLMCNGKYAMYILLCYKTCLQDIKNS
jgi:hypothetical protein